MLIEIKEEEAGIVSLVLNDPASRNAMSEAMAVEFAAAVAELKTRAHLRVLILTGAGESFSSGGHLDMLAQKANISLEKNRELMELFYSQFLSIHELPVPVIARINGHAVGAGLCLALACDVRIGIPEAKLGLHFVHLGLHPGMGVTYFLPRIVGPAKAAELLFAGRTLSAEKALEIGLLNNIASKATLDENVLTLAREIASAGPQAVRNLKSSLRESLHTSLSDCLKREALCQAEDYVGKEFSEGIRAAREKRKPKF